MATPRASASAPLTSAALEQLQELLPEPAATDAVEQEVDGAVGVPQHVGHRPGQLRPSEESGAVSDGVFPQVAPDDVAVDGQRQADEGQRQERNDRQHGGGQPAATVASRLAVGADDLKGSLRGAESPDEEEVAHGQHQGGQETRGHQVHHRPRGLGDDGDVVRGPGGRAVPFRVHARHVLPDKHVALQHAGGDDDDRQDAVAVGGGAALRHEVGSRDGHGSLGSHGHQQPGGHGAGAVHGEGQDLAGHHVELPDVPVEDVEAHVEEQAGHEEAEVSHRQTQQEGQLGGPVAPQTSQHHDGDHVAGHSQQQQQRRAEVPDVGEGGVLREHQQLRLAEAPAQVGRGFRGGGRNPGSLRHDGKSHCSHSTSTYNYGNTLST